MTEKFEIHGHDVEFLKNTGKAVIEIDLGDSVDECYLIDIFSVDEKDYVALISEETDQIYLFYYNDSFDKDEIDLEVIEDDDEVEEVYEIFTHYRDDDALDQLLEDYEDDMESFDDDDEDIVSEDFDGVDE